MGTFILIFILGTATGMVIIFFLSFSRNSPSASRVSLSQSGRGRPAMNRPRPVKQFSLLGCSRVGDPGGMLIWGTQIPALRFVCKHEPQGAPCASLKPIFIELALRYPEIYDGHSFHDWGQLLVDSDVLRVQDECIHITPAGRALLDMLAPATGRQAHDLAPQ